MRKNVVYCPKALATVLEIRIYLACKLSKDPRSDGGLCFSRGLCHLLLPVVIKLKILKRS